MIPEGYTIEPPKKAKIKNDNRQQFSIIFSKFHDKIDDIKFKNGYLKCYSEGKIVCSVPIFQDFTEDIRKNIRDLMPYFEVDEEGNLYAIYP